MRGLRPLQQAELPQAGLSAHTASNPAVINTPLRKTEASVLRKKKIILSTSLSPTDISSGKAPAPAAAGFCLFFHVLLRFAAVLFVCLQNTSVLTGKILAYLFLKCNLFLKFSAAAAAAASAGPFVHGTFPAAAGAGAFPEGGQPCRFGRKSRTKLSSG